MTETIVVNFRRERCDVKICRRPNNSIPDPPHDGCFGNPYHLLDPNDDAARDMVCDLYEAYFLKRVDSDLAFRKAVLALRGLKLGCHCKPKRCHGDTIAAWLSCNLE